MNGTLADDNPFRKIKVLPDSTPKPELWMLGSSGGSAGLAGQLGYNIALARFIDPDNCRPSIFDGYIAEWERARHEGVPNKALAIACICAETEEEAKLRAGTAVFRKLAAAQGIREPFLTPEDVRNRYNSFSPVLKAHYDKILADYTVGTPEQCAEEITRLASEFCCDEIATVTVTHSQDDRIDSYRQLMTGF